MYEPILILPMGVIGALLSYYVLRPMGVAAKSAIQNEKFFLVDLVSLVIALQFPLSFLSFVSKERSVADILFTGSFLILVVIAVWWRAVSVLSTLRIHDNLRRLVFVGFVLPLTLGFSISTVPLLYVMGASSRGNLGQSLSVELMVLFGVLLILMPFGLVTLRMMVNWVMEGSPQVHQAHRAGDSTPQQS